MIRVTLIILILNVIAAPAQATLVLNGGFEDGPIGFLGPSRLIIVPKPSAPTIPATAIDKWTVTANNVDFIESGAFGLVPHTGTYLIDLTGGDTGFGTIEQLLQLQIGQTYSLEFFIGGSDQFDSFGDSGDPSVAVGLSGVGNMTFTGSRGSANDWQQQSWTFVATQANTLLSFTGTQPDKCCYIGLDSVSLHGVAEPATVLVFALGIAGLGIARKSRPLLDV